MNPLSSKKVLIPVAIIVLLVIAGVVWNIRGAAKAPATTGKTPITTPAPKPVAQADYICNGDKTFNASFYEGTPIPVQPGEMPKPSGSVTLAFSDGETLTLNQTISADGARYANSDDTFVFWSKGNGAQVLENGVEKSHVGCMVYAKDPGGLTKVYHDATNGFTMRYPANNTVNATYVNQEFGPGKDIPGVKFLIPETMATGTNLSASDTGVSIEFVTSTDCQANLFVDGAPKATTVTEAGTEFSVATATQGAAGNRYEETAYAFPGSTPCVAVHYLVHSTVLENYPPGTITAFDHTALIKQFDAMRKTLIRR